MTEYSDDKARWGGEKKLVEKWWVARTKEERITLIFNVVHLMNDTVAAEIVERHHKSTISHPDGQTFREISRAMKMPLTTVFQKYNRAITVISRIARSREKHK
jgi:hypothetical protein